MSFPGAETIVGLIFLTFVALTAMGALLAVSTTRIIRSVCGLAVCCIGLAGMFYFLHSPFLALMEILIYVGAVCVTIVFAIMLAEPEEPKVQEKRAAAWLWTGLALGVSGTIAWSLWRLGTNVSMTLLAPRVNDGSVKQIGTSLLTTYSLAFELISLVLLVAILGALAIARPGRVLATQTPPTPQPLPSLRPLSPKPEARPTPEPKQPVSAAP